MNLLASVFWLLAPDPPLQAGLARIDITPETPIRLSGYGNRRAESEGVEQRLYARAVALGDAIILNVEVCGAPEPLVEKVAAALQKTAGIARERFVVCSTHTHTGPCLSGNLELLFGVEIPADHQKRIDAYTEALAEKLVAVCTQALADRAPATLSWAQGSVGFAANRRVVTNSKWAGFGVTGGAAVDHALPVLRITGADGKLRGLLTNYACHCTTLGGGFNKICGDWAGYAQEYIEADHPGAIAAVVIGCGADSNPNPRGSLDPSKKHGRALADEVKRLLAGPWTPVNPTITAKLERIKLPFAAPPDFEQRAKEPGVVGMHARHFLAKGVDIPKELDYPVAVWTFGDDLAMVFLAGEVVVDYSLRLKREWDASRLWVTAYANDVPCYIPSRRILAEGGYEADHSMLYYGRPTRFAPEVEDRIHAAIGRLLPPQYRTSRPRDPEAGRASIRTLPGYRVQLAAAEPLVADPVAFDWGPDGRLWVVEMRDYPSGVDGGGRVKRLTDDDGDGRYDRADLWLEGLSFPTGLKVWRDGLLITAAPDILFARDTDGDGKADQVDKLYSGFGTGNQQHRVNGLRWRLDNRLQIGNGDSGGTIRSSKTGATVNVSGRDLAIEPDSGALEAQSGQTQFGTCTNDWGDWFGGNNSVAIWHYVLPDPYLKRNPHVKYPDPRKIIVSNPIVRPISPTLERFNDFHTLNHFTSACSPEIYRDELMGPEGTWFVCEPVHNLVHRERLIPDGVSFRSEAIDGDREFLASSDNWFRPVMARTGPDGALWIADMYRYVIEHPKWIPPEWQARLDLRAGDTRGRIYRVVPEKKGARPFPKLSGLSTEQLVESLESPNGWVRDMAQQMIVWKGDKGAAALLEKMVREGRRPQARVHALWTLQGLGALDPALVDTALKDASPGVRRNAMKLDRKADRVPPSDQNPHVALQAAFTYRPGKLGDADPFLAAAKLSSVLPFLDQIEPTPELIPVLVATDRRTAMARLFAGEPDPETIAGLLETLQRQKGSVDAVKSELAPLSAKARSALTDRNMRLLGYEPEHRDADTKLLTGLMEPRNAPEIQARAVEVLARMRLPDLPARLLEGWATRPPAMRASILDTLLSRQEWTEALLARPEVLVSLDATRRSALLNHKAADIRKKAEAVLGPRPGNADLQKTIDQFTKDLVGLTGGAAAGRPHFELRCAPCHRVGDLGKSVGADLLTLKDRSDAALLAAVIDPNRAVEDRFLQYRAVTADDRVLEGMILSETGTSVTLRAADGAEHALLRTEIKELTSGGRSLMPEQLERGLTPQQMADLLAFVRTSAVPPKQFPNNQPETVNAAADGSFTLPGSKAALFGPSIIFEQQYRNIGWWNHPDDHALWTLQVAKAGEFEVELDWALADGNKGNRFAMTAGAMKLEDLVPSTGNWDTYQKKVFGRIKLESGAQSVIFRSAGAINGALIDLRTIRLVPVK